MRRPVRLWAVLALVCISTLAGCDTEQPVEVAEQSVQIRFSSENAVVAIYNVWDVFQDADGDALPDDITGDGVPDVFPFCEQARSPVTGQPLTGAALKAPWPFSLRIKLLRADASEAETLTSGSSLNVNSNLTPYDDEPIDATVPSCPIAPAVPCPDPGGTLFHANRRQLSGAAREILDWSLTPNPLQFSCNGATSPDFGDARLDGAPAPFELTLQKGDTVIVEARKTNVAPIGFPVIAEPQLAGELFLNGQQILASSIQGDTVSDTAGGSAVSFSFTAR